MLNEKYWRNNFNTELGDEDERAYQNWLEEQKTATGRDLSNDEFDYDTRGYWKNMGSNDSRGHGPDTYKKPNHPSFSNESIYHGTRSPWGDPYEGGQWAEASPGKFTYTPSKSMLKKTHSVPLMKDYFKRVEPDTQLIVPE